MVQVSTVDDAFGHPDSNEKNITSYKIVISILFGLLGWMSQPRALFGNWLHPCLSGRRRGGVRILT